MLFEILAEKKNVLADKFEVEETREILRTTLTSSGNLYLMTAIRTQSSGVLSQCLKNNEKWGKDNNYWISINE
jgi:hypothetical protein